MKYIKQFKWNLMFAFLVLAAAVLLDASLVSALPLAGFFGTTSTAQLGNGTLLDISTGSPTTYIRVANVHNLAWDNGTNPEQEVTNLTSPAKEFLMGLPDSGTLTADVDLDMGDAGQIALNNAKASRVACDVKITLPGGTTPTWTARGYVRKFDKATGVDATVKANLEIRITGPWTPA